MEKHRPGSGPQFKINHTILCKLPDDIARGLPHRPGVVRNTVHQGKHLKGVVKTTLLS